MKQREPMVKAREVMKYLGVGKTKLYELIALDCLPYYNLAATAKQRPDYRFKMSEIDTWTKERSGFRK